MHDLNTLLGVMSEYFGGVLVLVLIVLRWRFDRRGRASVTSKASYVLRVDRFVNIREL